MFEPIIRRGIIMTVGVLILVVLGVVATFRIPVQMIPDLEVRTISVQTTWPGATPQDIEKEILIEQEEYLRNVPNLQRMTATAVSGQATIELDFPFGVDVTETLILVNNALNQVRDYPANVDEPRIFAASFSSNAFMYYRVSPLPGNPQQLNMVMKRDFVEDNVRNRMSSVDGVSQITVSGGAERQIQIHLDPQALANRRITVTRVRDIILNRNQDTSAGEVESGKRRYLLRTVGRYDDFEELKNTVIAQQGDQITRLRDVATVVFDHYELRSESWNGNDPVIGLQVQRELGSNVINIKYAMQEEVDRINKEVLEPAGMILELTSDDVRYVEASVSNVLKNLALGAVFATLVMYLFLRNVKITAVGVLGIPICTIAAFLGLLLFGRTINVISLAGVAFAIGMTLDNTVVVLESIELARKQGMKRFEAAVAGVRQVWPAVLAATLTTIMVFLPIVFIQEEAGQLYSDVAIAIASAIFVSMLVAITLVPTLLARVDFPDQVKETGSGLKDAAVERFARSFSSRKARVTTLIATLVTSGAIVFWLTPPAEYLPEGEEAKTFATMSAPPGYNLETMSDIAAELRDYFTPALDYDAGQYAKGEVDIPALMTFTLNVSPESIMIIAETKVDAEIQPLMDIITRKYESYPGMRAFASKGSIISSNDGGTRSVNLDISGADLQAVYRVALAAYRKADEVLENPRIQSQPSALSLAQPLVQVRPDWRRLEELGLTAEDFGYLVAALTDGAFVNEFFMADDKIDIFLYSSAGPQKQLDQLPDLPVYGPLGGPVPLSSLAEIVQTVDTSTVRRVDGRRTVTLNIIPPQDIPLEQGVQIVINDVVGDLRDQGVIPADITTSISGAADQLAATQAELSTNYIVALVIIYLLLVAIFSHWGYPLLIMATIPLGVAGGLVGLALMNGIGSLLPLFGLRELNQPFDMITMLGFLILMGTVVNNPILIVHRSVENAREAGKNIVEAVREAVDSRIRPIAIATITTGCGLSPLVFIPGEGTELYRGVGAIVLFGLIGATIVTLTTLPALTVTILKIRERWRQ
ncbi:efflux RND transporter permease subunit [Pseudidiomarina sp.]|uniref:efflux RND transporter permease subunit n=1 Tax=Pseudidiomarina sp. TaxID=2081707 RepID=UPI00299DB548|nr:efflux RND transporter permease subunit [Pseudidiomarina sp.]MDX1704995.1 efflux RND transporter permease subunit [Pseudidiomarina sp.]